MYVKEKTRITSYNVCYTKLLRYSPLPWVRIGGSVHTPTFYDLRDSYYTSVTSSFEDPTKSKSEDSYLGSFDYELTSPFRANASLGFIIQKIALVNIDYEYVDYSLARLRSYDYVFSGENENIRTEYKPSHNRITSYNVCYTKLLRGKFYNNIF